MPVTLGNNIFFSCQKERIEHLFIDFAQVVVASLSMHDGVRLHCSVVPVFFAL